MNWFTSTQIRNFFTFRSIKSKLIGAFLLFSLFVIMLTAVFVWFIFRQNQLDKLGNQLQSVSFLLNKVQQQEKNFFLFDQHDLFFFSKGKSEHLILHKEYLQETKFALRILRDHPQQYQEDFQDEIKATYNQLEAYEFLFDQLVSQVRLRGFQKFGLVGEIHDFVEKIDAQNFIKTQVEWQELRRAEKDFQIRKEDRFVQQFKQYNEQLIAKVEKQLPKSEENQSTLQLLKLYRIKFLRLVEIHKEIGLYANRGLIGKLADLSQEITSLTNDIHHQITAQNTLLTTRLKSVFTALALAFVALNVLLGYFVVHKMGKPINLLSDSIHKIIESDFDKDIKIYQSKSNNEVGGISRDVAKMVEFVRQHSEKIHAQNEEIAAAYQNVKLLSDIGRDITAQLKISDIINVVSAKVENFMESNSFTIAIYNSEKKRLELLSQQTDQEKLITLNQSIEEKDSLAVHCFTHAMPLLINDYHNEIQDYLPNAVVEKEEKPVFQSRIYVPLISLDECIGVVVVQSYLKNVYQAYHVDILQNMGNNISVALENADIYQKLKQRNKRIVDSISYAQRIQEAMLPSIKTIQESLPESFILFKPRDIVSGDFYWFCQLEPKPIYEEVVASAEGIRSEFKGFQPPKTLIAAIDCTGHGVPGAFMSMIGNDLLDSIVIEHNVTRPDEILNRMHQGIRTTMKQKLNENSDGMDIALCTIDFEHGYLEYAGAFNPLVVIQDGEMQIIKADKKLVGVWYRENEQRTYTRHRIKLDKPTTIYIHSDGFVDQLGGTKKKKFLSKRLHRFLYEIHRRPMFEQKLLLETKLRNWIGEGTQNDDILVIGFHLEPPSLNEEFN